MLLSAREGPGQRAVCIAMLDVLHENDRCLRGAKLPDQVTAGLAGRRPRSCSEGIGSAMTMLAIFEP